VAGLRWFGLGLCAVLAAPAFVACFDDLAVMGEPVEQCGCHLGVHCPAVVLYNKTMRGAKDAGPFAEGQIGCDDDRAALVKLADQMEQELTAGVGEREIAQLIQE